MRVGRRKNISISLQLTGDAARSDSIGTKRWQTSAQGPSLCAVLRELSFGPRPQSVVEIIDYCCDRPVLMGQVRSEYWAWESPEGIVPKRSLESERTTGHVAPAVRSFRAKSQSLA